jgi:hypothetical protein
MTTHQPIANCYWVSPGSFLAGEYPRNTDDASSPAKVAALEKAGVAAFIDLTEENEGLLPYAALLTVASHQRFPIRDGSVPASPALTTAILDAIDGHIRNREMVYLHCLGGIGRTGLIVGCWLARRGLGGAEALIRLRELWQQCPKSAYRNSPETEAQAQYIVGWKEPR